MSDQPFAPKPGPRAPVPGPGVPGPPWSAAPAPGAAPQPAPLPTAPLPTAPDGAAEDVDDRRPTGRPAAGTSSGDAVLSGLDEAVAGHEREPEAESEPTQARASDREPTGDAAVDQALDLLDSVSGESLDRHIEVGQQVHRTLQARLADIGRE